MKAAMGPLAVLAIVGGVVRIPGRDDALEHVPRADLRGLPLRATSTERPAEWVGLGRGGLHRDRRHRLAYVVYLRRRGHRSQLRERFAACTASSCNKWYFDELFDAVFVRPVAALGRFGRRRGRDRRSSRGRSSAAPPAPCARAARSRAPIQTGYLRGYALLLLSASAALALYFLIASS